jgi:hypothetical protein
VRTRGPFDLRSSTSARLPCGDASASRRPRYRADLESALEALASEGNIAAAQRLAAIADPPIPTIKSVTVPIPLRAQAFRQDQQRHVNR